MDAKKPKLVERQRDPAGEHILFSARQCSKIAKQGGDAVSDLPDRDVDRVGRYRAHRAEVAIGGELVPEGDCELRDTIKNPDYVTVDASRARLELASHAGVLELALDASDTIDSKNSLEKMMAHQMALLHRQIMTLGGRLDDIALPSFPAREDFQQRNVEICRVANAIARMTAAFQSGLLALHRARSGGHQIVTVQHVHVGDGGQAVVAGKLGAGGGLQKRARGSAKNDR
jgi:hypothetical protein